ncbi:hypothetical protein HOU08_gp171 [Dickeya phage vB_DsoM_JA29]|uniref:Uncharacterized protein n=1 Tax=Dickeya phage vB_DsoM_JA29 TaxID=2283031 RepID=A0A384ZXE0_9CAUD|nr:hypothetical protein HOU08_gp171 [Dickeya phage vB_DsoM_JA29]AXG66897.1 hypothetical protein JA29_171 [Dickeya phage vB_DsoM_JA29]
MQTSIKQIDSINQNQCVVLAHVVHADGENIADNYGAVLSESAQREFIPVAGSSVVIHGGRTQSYVRTIMQRAKDILPMEDAREMQALSANMYMDKSKRMWAVRHSESGQDILVRTSDMNDTEELMDMIRSVSNVSAAGLRSVNPDVAKALDKFNLDIAGTQGGDMVSYVSESGDLRVGFVVAQIQDNDEIGYQVVDKEGNAEVISSMSMVAVFDGDNIEDRHFPEMDSVSAAGNATVEKLVNYYRQVFSYSPEYMQRLENIIRNHGF